MKKEFDIIRWGIIGCGDVTERKSGPAFRKVPHSDLVAVMRRDAAKLADYAQRHQVDRFYTDASDLLNDPGVNAVYIATPPESHEDYCIRALEMGKPVYVEKPMALTAAAARRMYEAAERTHTPLVVAHYRRAQPYFRKIADLLHEGAIGRPRTATLEMYRKALSPDELAQPKTAWRVNPSIAGGGLFHDLSPHQLDLLLHWFGRPKQVNGLAFNQAALYEADDMVMAHFRFENGLALQGSWCFTVGAAQERDSCRITGDAGTIDFSFFDRQEIRLKRGESAETMLFEPLEHVQQPMIQEVVNYFRGMGPNPCPPEDGVYVMEWIEQICAR